MAEVDLQIGEFAEDAEVTRMFLKETNRPALLSHMVDDGCDQDFSCPGRPRPSHRRSGSDERANPRLHVHHGVPVEAAFLDTAGVRIVVPALANRLCVYVTSENKSRAGTPGLDHPNDVWAPGFHFLRVHLVIAHAPHARLQQLGDLRLITDHTRRLHKPLGKGDGFLAVDHLE